MPSMTLIWDTT